CCPGRHFCCVMLCISLYLFFFFCNDTPTTVFYTLSLHDALPIFRWFWSTLLTLHKGWGSLPCVKLFGWLRQQRPNCFPNRLQICFRSTIIYPNLLKSI